MFRRGPTLTEKVPRQDNHRSPHRPAERAVEEERVPAHAADSGHKRFEHAGDREETGCEDGLAAVANEESLDLIQALWGELHIAPPLQYELSSSFVAHPVTDLVSDDGSKDAKQYGVPEVEVALLNQYASSQENGRARDGDAHGPEHHAQEDDQIPVVFDQRVEFFHRRRSIEPAPILSAPQHCGE